MQLADLRLGLNSAGEWDWSRGALTFYYGTVAVNAVNPLQNSTDNNGNVLRQMNYVPLSAGGYVMPKIDDYQDDPLNRIQQVSESRQSFAGQVSFLFTQKYAYDRCAGDDSEHPRCDAQDLCRRCGDQSADQLRRLLDDI